MANILETSRVGFIGSYSMDLILEKSADYPGELEQVT